MRTKYHFCLLKKARLVEFLDGNCIPYEMTELPEQGGCLCTFDLYKDQDTYTKFQLKFPITARYEAVKMAEYSKSDIENAEWLIVKNKGCKVEWKYEKDAFRNACSYKKLFFRENHYRHSEQVGLLSSTKNVKWGTRQFFTGPDTADDMIFCSERARQILDDMWQGLEFWPVKKYNTSQYIMDLYQLVFKDSLPIEAMRGGHWTTCDACGRQIIRITKGIQQVEFDRQYLKNPYKVYKTGDVLTSELMGCTTFSLNIVSREFYQYCERHQMNRGMVYEPIRLV